MLRIIQNQDQELLRSKSGGGGLPFVEEEEEDEEKEEPTGLTLCDGFPCVSGLPASMRSAAIDRKNRVDRSLAFSCRSYNAAFHFVTFIAKSRNISLAN